jgi:hypothetical protein
MYVPLQIPAAWAGHLVATKLFNELLFALVALLNQRIAQCLLKLQLGFLNNALLLVLGIDRNNFFALAQGMLFLIAKPAGNLPTSTLPALANEQRMLARRRQNALELAERTLGHVLDLQALYSLLRDQNVPSLNEFLVDQANNVLPRQHGSALEPTASDGRLLLTQLAFNVFLRAGLADMMLRCGRLASNSVFRRDVVKTNVAFNCSLTKSSDILKGAWLTRCFAWAGMSSLNARRRR